MAGSLNRQDGGGWPALHPVVMTCSSELSGLSGPSKTQGLSEAARKALEWSAKISEVTLGALGKDSRGAPLPSGNIHWSISHTEGCVAAVVAPSRVGIDIEQIREVDKKLMAQVASAREWDIGPAYDNLLFFRYWTAKEAVLKATGHGLSGLPDCRITEIVDDSHIRLSCSGVGWLVQQRVIMAGQDKSSPTHLAAVTQGLPVTWHAMK